MRFCFERLNSSLTFIYRFLMSWRQNLLHGGVGARTFIYHSLSDSSLSVLQRPSAAALRDPASAWMLHIVYSRIILYAPQNNSPLTPSEETFCSQCTNARSLFIGLLFLGGGQKSLRPEGKQRRYIPIMRSVSDRRRAQLCSPRKTRGLRAANNIWITFERVWGRKGGGGGIEFLPFE